MYLKFLFLLALAVLGARSDSSEELANFSDAEADFFKTLIQLGYEEDKLSIIENVAQEFSEDVPNITIVGWQNVLNENGELKHIAAVTLHLPKLGNSSVLEEIKSDNDEDEDVWSELDELTKMFGVLSSIGLPMEISHVEYDTSGNITERVYLDADTQYITDGGLGYLNQTIVVHNEQPIKQTIQHHSGGAIDVAVVKYDSDHKLIESESKLVPELYVTIEDEDNTTEELLQSVIKGLGKIAIDHITETEKIPKELALYLKQHHPNYLFHVTTDIDGYYVSKDVYVHALFSLTNYEIGDLAFYIFGVELPKSKK